MRSILLDETLDGFSLHPVLFPAKAVPREGLASTGRQLAKKTLLEAAHEKIHSPTNFRRISAIQKKRPSENLRLLRCRFLVRLHGYSGTLGRS